jgi:pimeloyl-ACP methyl ester carboxylesterase
LRASVRAALLLALMPTVLVAPGCTSPQIKERHFLAYPTARPCMGCAAPCSIDPTSPDEIAFNRIKNQVEGPAGSDPRQLIALADLADRIGCDSIGRDPAAALPWFRDAAAYAMFGLMATGSPNGDPELSARAVARHNHAVLNLIRCAGSDPRRANPVWREQLAAAGVEVASTTPERSTLAYDELWISSDFRVSNLEQVRRDGVGVPLIALTNFPDRSAIPDRFYPERLRLPATAVLRPAGALQSGAWRSRPAVLSLHDPARETTVNVALGSGDLVLAADLTTPLAHQIIKSPLDQLAWGGMFRPEAYDSVLGIFMKEPRQAGKIPVLLIHGLWSSPDVWLVMVNSLQADPLIRARYQFWFAYYPTGAPLLLSAGRVRQSIHELRDAVDPAHTDPALDQMVVVGHSLGGVMSKQFIQSSGPSVERALFTRPLDQAAMSSETRMLLSRYLVFEPEPSIRRTVFIAAPHHGSNAANRLIGRLGSTLIRRPGALAAIHDEISALNGPEVWQPFYRSGPPSSIDNLAWDSPILKTLSELPIAPGVPYHSIVANLFPDAPPRFWTDGVVPYESAHLDGAQSEVMVRHNHFVNDTIEVTREVHRILRLHVGSDGTIASP